MSVTSAYTDSGLRGRRRECGALHELLDKARTGSSGVLVMRGEAGIGKTALLDYAARQAHGFRVARVCGVESEMELPFAALQQLLAAMLARMDRLPGPQRESLAVALGEQEGAAPDRLRVGLAVLSLLADTSDQQPLACLIDDAYWLDRSSLRALAFSARRLVAERVAVLFAIPDTSHIPELTGFPDLPVTRLDDPDARLLLASAVHGRLDPSVADRVVGEAHGNPLALLQLPRILGPADLAGGFGLPGTRPLPDRLKTSFVRQYQSLPDSTRSLLLIAAAEPTGDVPLLWRAAATQSIGTDAAVPAESADLAEFGSQVQFRHPIVRSAIYQAATPAERRAAHQALAEATDPRVDPDRWAWHRARAAAGPDEVVAAELECSAGRAEARGGVAAQAEFLQKAAELTPDPAVRAPRALAAAQAKFAAGSADAAYRLLGTAAIGPLDALQQARASRLRARIAFSWTRGSDAPALLLDAAKQLARLAPDLGRETYLEATEAAIAAGRLGSSPDLLEAAAAARNAPRPPQPPRAIDILLDGLVTRFTEGYIAGVAPLRTALQALEHDDPRTCRHESLWYWLRVECSLTPEPIAPDIWDDQAWHDLGIRSVGRARDAGAVIALSTALSSRACAQVHAGEFDEAAMYIEEAEAIAQVTGSAPPTYARLALAGWRGQEAQALDFFETSIKDASARGEGRTIGMAEYAMAVLYNGLGRYETALAAARRACQYEDPGVFGRSLVELIEAAARSGDQETGSEALAMLAERTRASGTDWARGIEARSRALLSAGQTADTLYREGVQRLGRTRLAVDLARAQLIYGEWLRRENRREEAREALRPAYAAFSRIGADAFAERTRRELMATGETVRKRAVDNATHLTAQEAQIAQLAKDGLTNPEIAARLFISPRTVEWHLSHVFGKLGIASRKDLR